MGLISRKNKANNEEPPSPTRLAKMADEDLYLLLETSLMTAQQQLMVYRTSPASDKAALLNWIGSNLETASLGCQEMSSRI